MMILFTNVMMLVLVIITGMLWSEYRRDVKMAKYRGEIEKIDEMKLQRDYEDFCRNPLQNIV